MNFFSLADEYVNSILELGCNAVLCIPFHCTPFGLLWAYSLILFNAK